MPKERTTRTKEVLGTVEIAAKKAGFDKDGAHTMRHSAAKAWLESGVRIKAVVDLAKTLGV